jgi:HPt (histidine-containing phosphotransfer) domain-containing protein
VERNGLIDAIARFATRSRTPAPQSSVAPTGIEALRPRFLANRKADLVKLKAALEGGDFKTIQRIGHDCKGVGAGYGFPEISAAGAALETAAKSGDPEAIASALEEFERVVLAAAGEPVVTV